MPTPTGSIAITPTTTVDNVQQSGAVLTGTTSASLMTGWQANGPYSTFNDGDQSVQPDFANNRVLVHKPGNYEIIFDALIYADADMPAQFDVYVNGAPVPTVPITAPSDFGGSKTIPVHCRGVYSAPIVEGQTQDSVQVYLTSNDYNGNTVTLTVVAATLTVNRIS